MKGDPGRSLTPEEIESIKHEITPVEKIVDKKSAYQGNITAPRVKEVGRRKETVDKLR